MTLQAFVRKMSPSAYKMAVRLRHGGITARIMHMPSRLRHGGYSGQALISRLLLAAVWDWVAF